MARGMPVYPRTPDRVVPHPAETPVAPDWLHEELQQFRKAIGDLTKLIEDTSHRVDEYQTQAINESNLTIFTTPDYDVYPEIIEAVMVTGPTNTAFTLQLGKRLWTLTTSAVGFFFIGPLKMSLDRDDSRVLTSATPGNWSLELMGYADVRYRFK